MVFDRTENEPEEWDPEEDLYDAESDGLTVPQVSTGDDGPDDDLSDLADAIDPPTVSTAETDVPSDVLQTFWALVLVLNAAVLVASLGLLLIVFEGELLRGGVLVAAGVVLFGFAGRRYGQFQRDGGADTADEPDTGDGTDTAIDTGTDGGTEADAGPTESRSADAAETTSGGVPQDRSPDPNDSP
ncbi:DUF7322 domain-containing protein [Natrinema amylolyticum]|uniref:DUF7322 domain-containing protein n=1 Tax=Natrinema amylolyticum TaxID=2878679 RepID=UPI001CF97A20|nr:hypothetical protein [Natrinema amylolyticum]